MPHAPGPARRAPALVTACALLALTACAGPPPATDPPPAAPTPSATAAPSPATTGAGLEHLADALVYDPAALDLPADAGAHFAAADLSTFAAQALEAFDVVMETSEQTQRPDSAGPLPLASFEPVAGHLTPSAWALLVSAFEAGDQPTVSALVPSSALVPAAPTPAPGAPAPPGGTAESGTASAAPTEQVASIEPYRPTGEPTVELVVPAPGAARLAVTFSYQRVFGAPDGERVYDTDHTLYLVPVEGRWLVDGWRTSYPTLAP